MTRSERIAHRQRRIGRAKRIVRRECARHFQHIPKTIESVVQVGLGKWFEGAHLRRRFRTATYFAIEPIAAFHRDALRAGFPGQIILGAAWDRSGETLTFAPRGERTSMFVARSRREPITIQTFTMDELFADKANRAFLWLDCEGSELRALRGAEKLLKKCLFVLVEVQTGGLPGYAHKGDVLAFLRSRGFEDVSRAGATVLFARGLEYHI